MSITKTKIVATLGPASANKETMLAMINEGVNVFRINFSHSNHEDAVEMIKIVRSLNLEYDLNIAVLADLQGPKLRIGEVEKGSVINPGDKVLFTNNKQLGNSKKVYMTYPHFATDVKVGERILLDDGKLALKVLKTNGIDEVETEVLHGGPLNSKKGVNLPNTRISLPCLTDKDLADLKVAMAHEVEWIGLSFVRSADDVIQLKNIIQENDAVCKVISKIEKPEAVVEIDRIIEETDAIMVARGDLGVEVPLQSVPLIQKMIVNKCHKAAKPVVIATQMMETMIDNYTPTRAEVNDVANSVLDGADAVMLSGETSVGKHPVRVIEVMTKIISHIEESGQMKPADDNPPVYRNKRFITDSICYNASKIADQTGASAILTMSFSGYTGFKVSSHRPKTNIIVFTANRSILNMVSLVWGVRGYFYDNMESTDKTFKEIRMMVKEMGIVSEGDLVIKIASMPIEESGMTNMLKIAQID